MAIRYPNGRQYTPKNKAANSDSKKKSDILAKDKLTFSNRGKSLEDDIDEANAFYFRPLRPKSSFYKTSDSDCRDYS